MRTICFFNSNRVWGGGEKWHRDIALNLNAQGYPTLMLTNAASELARRMPPGHLPVFSLNISNTSFLNPRKILSVARIFRQHQVRTLFLNLPADLKIGGLAARLAGVKQVIYRRGIALPIKDRRLNRYLLRQVVTTVLTNSQETKRLILAKGAHFIPEEKIRVIYNGIDLPVWDSLAIQPIYERAPGELILGTAGRLSAEKGQALLIDLTKRLKEEGIACKMLIAGTGPLADRLAEYAAELGVAQDVLFVGFVEQIKNFMESIDIFLLPSLYEGAANVLLEAMAARKAVVAFNVSSNPEIIRHETTGLLAEPANIEDLSAQVKRLALDAKFRQILGTHARQKVETSFSMQRVMKEITNLIEL